MVQKLAILKYRERWEKLKESAKKKKEAKAQANTHIGSPEGVQERIEEDPEAEERERLGELREESLAELGRDAEVVG